MTTTIDGTTGLTSNAGVFGDASGNVGIGTTSPSTYGKLAVVGTGVVIAGVVGDGTNEAQVVFSNATAGRVTVAGAFPLLFQTNGSERMRIDSSGNVLVTNVAGLGYGTGAGGSVTQGTSRTTAVTLNKPTGKITMFTAAGSATPNTFTVNNSLVAATDTILINLAGGNTNVYYIFATGIGAGSFVITFWTTGGTASDTPVINFSVIKGVTA